jgi:hypothetical protein
MNALECDVIGCGRPASWVRSRDLDDTYEDFLCNICWATLRVLFPEEAACYLVCDPVLAESRLTTANAEEVILIE